MYPRMLASERCRLDLETYAEVHHNHIPQVLGTFFTSMTSENQLRVYVFFLSLPSKDSQQFECRILQIQKFPSTFICIRRRPPVRFRKFGRQSVGKNSNPLNSHLCSPEVYDNSSLTKFRSSTMVD